MWNNGLDILWSHFSHFYFQDLDNWLHLLPKITCDHVVLNSYTKFWATQYHQLFVRGPPEFSETAQFYRIMDSFFYCINVRNLNEHQKKREPFLALYTR